MGDSHVRRIAEFEHVARQKLSQGQVRISFYYRGGAGLRFIEENMEVARGYDLLVVMAGGNDLDNGASYTSMVAMYDRIVRKAMEKNIRAVAITSVWPRSNRAFNQRARYLSERLDVHYATRDQVMFWMWDRRQRYRTIDGVHLLRKAYKKAVSYLLGVVLWCVNNML